MDRWIDGQMDRRTDKKTDRQKFSRILYDIVPFGPAYKKEHIAYIIGPMQYGHDVPICLHDIKLLN